MPPIESSPQDSSRNGSASGNTVIPLPSLRAKFRLELYLEAGLVAAGGLAALVMALGLRGYARLPILVPSVIVLVTVAVAVRLMRVSLARLRLTDRPDGQCIRADATSLTVPVTALLSRNVLTERAEEAAVTLPWARIASWTVHPARAGARTRAPAHHEVVVGEGAATESFYISREDLGDDADATLRRLAAAHAPRALDVRDPRLLRTPPGTARIA